jgi:ABC-type glutathione transport system ATPase component
MLRNGVTMILVSHNLNEVKNLCDNTLMLWKGERVTEGPTNKVLEEYYHRVVEMIRLEERTDAAQDDRVRADQPLVITGMKFIDKNGIPTDNFFTGDPMTIRVAYEARARVEKPAVAIEIEWAADDLLLTKLDTQVDGIELAPIEPGAGHFDLKLGPMLMEPNVYTVRARIIDGPADATLDTVQRQRFVLNEQAVVSGFYALPHEWEQVAGQARESQPRDVRAEHGAAGASHEAA